MRYCRLELCERWKLLKLVDISFHTQHMVNYFVKLYPLCLKLLVKLEPVFSEENLLSTLD